MLPCEALPALGCALLVGWGPGLGTGDAIVPCSEKNTKQHTERPCTQAVALVGMTKAILMPASMSPGTLSQNSLGFKINASLKMGVSPRVKS